MLTRQMATVLSVMFLAPAIACADGAAASQPAATSSYADAVQDYRRQIEALRELPLPGHTIEGYGGGAFTPVAYLVNPGKKGEIFGLPAASFSNLIAGSKNVQSFAVTETLLRRIELGYAAARVGLGSLPDDIEKRTGVEIDDDLWVHVFNARGMILEEGSFGLPLLPALTAGAHFKINEGIDEINDRLHGGFSRIGYDRSEGTDFTLTATKTLIHPLLTVGRPLTLSAGLRNSRGAQLGALGFGDRCRTTVEANVGYLVTKNLLIGYEFRQKRNPYDEVPGLLGDEDNWNGVGFSWLAGRHFSLTAGWAALGTLANTTENCAWYVQLKYEF